MTAVPQGSGHRGPGDRRRGPGGGTVVRTGRIRTWAPVAALTVPALLAGLAGLILAAWPCEGSSCGTPYLGAWGLLLVAFPTALLAGLPWFASPITVGAAVVSGLGVWVWLGVRAGREATHDIDATWRAYWRELAFLAGGVAVGVGLGGVILLVVVSFL